MAELGDVKAGPSMKPEERIRRVTKEWLDIIECLLVVSALSYIASKADSWPITIVSAITSIAFAAYCSTYLLKLTKRFVTPWGGRVVEVVLTVFGFLVVLIVFYTLTSGINNSMDSMIPG